VVREDWQGFRQIENLRDRLHAGNGIGKDLAGPQLRHAITGETEEDAGRVPALLALQEQPTHSFDGLRLTQQLLFVFYRNKKAYTIKPTWIALCAMMIGCITFTYACFLLGMTRLRTNIPRTKAIATNEFPIDT
jgi:hypothetical protein